MLKEYKFKAELHSHTSPASSCSDIAPEKLVEIYKNAGYDSIALTNHFKATQFSGDNGRDAVTCYLDDYYRSLELGKKVGLSVILGAELRFSQNRNEYLIYGICPDDLYDIKDLLGVGIDEFYKTYKNDKNIILQAHPFRNNMEPVNPDSLDGIEVFNMHPNHNSRVALAAKYAREHNLIPVCGSDFHHYGQECLCSIYTKEKLTDSFKLAQVLKNQDYIMEIGGYKLLPENI